MVNNISHNFPGYPTTDLSSLQKQTAVDANPTDLNAANAATGQERPEINEGDPAAPQLQEVVIDPASAEVVLDKKEPQAELEPTDRSNQLVRIATIGTAILAASAVLIYAFSSRIPDIKPLPEPCVGGTVNREAISAAVLQISNNDKLANAIFEIYSKCNVTNVTANNVTDAVHQVVNLQNVTMTDEKANDIADVIFKLLNKTPSETVNRVVDPVNNPETDVNNTPVNNVSNQPVVPRDPGSNPPISQFSATDQCGNNDRTIMQSFYQSVSWATSLFVTTPAPTFPPAPQPPPTLSQKQKA
jgi:hypothetical protein